MTEDDRDLTRADTLIDLGRYDEAETVLRRYLVENPDSPTALGSLAMTLRHQRRFAEAEETIRSAIAIEPEDPAHLLALTEVMIGLDDSARAVEAGKRALTLEPDSWVTHYTFARALRIGSRPRLREAYRHAIRARDLAPWSPDAHNLVGMCADDFDRDDETRRAYTEALRLDPQHAMAMNNLAALELNRGRLFGAAAGLTAAAGSAPQETIIHGNLDVLILRFAQRIFWILIAAGAVVAFELVAGVPWIVRALTGVLMIGIYVWSARKLREQLPKGMPLWSWQLVRRSSWGARILLSITAVVTAAVMTAAFGPADVGWAAFVLMLRLYRFVAIAFIAYFVGAGAWKMLRSGADKFKKQ